MGPHETTSTGKRPHLASSSGVHELDAPQGPSHGVNTDVLTRAAVAGAKHVLDAGADNFAANHPKLMSGLRAVGLTVLALLGGAGGSAVLAPEPAPVSPIVVAPEPSQETAPRVDDGPSCDPGILRYVLHMAKHGEKLAERLAADGLNEHAEILRDMTNVNRLPEDLQLCALLDRTRTKEPK